MDETVNSRKQFMNAKSRIIGINQMSVNAEKHKIMKENLKEIAGRGILEQKETEITEREISVASVCSWLHQQWLMVLTD
jgi:hypothetical protein